MVGFSNVVDLSRWGSVTNQGPKNYGLKFVGLDGKILQTGESEYLDMCK